MTIEVLISFAVIFSSSTALLALACKKYIQKINEGRPSDEAYQETLDETLDK